MESRGLNADKTNCKSILHAACDENQHHGSNTLTMRAHVPTSGALRAELSETGVERSDVNLLLSEDCVARKRALRTGISSSDAPTALAEVWNGSAQATLVVTVSKFPAHKADTDTIGDALARVASAGRTATIYVHVGVYQEGPLLVNGNVCLVGLTAQCRERLPCPFHLPRPVLVASRMGEPWIRCSGNGAIIRNFHFAAPECFGTVGCLPECWIEQPATVPKAITPETPERWSDAVSTVSSRRCKLSTGGRQTIVHADAHGVTADNRQPGAKSRTEREMHGKASASAASAVPTNPVQIAEHLPVAPASDLGGSGGMSKKRERPPELSAELNLLNALRVSRADLQQLRSSLSCKSPIGASSCNGASCLSLLCLTF